MFFDCRFCGCSRLALGKAVIIGRENPSSLGLRELKPVKPITTLLQQYESKFIQRNGVKVYSMLSTLIRICS